MSALITAELLKLRTTRSAWIPLAVALAFAVLAVVVVTTWLAGSGDTPPLSAAMLPDLLRASGGQLLNGAVLLAWVVLSAGEFRHRTAVTTFLGEPRRLRVVGAKVAAAAITGLAVGLAAEALSAGTTAVTFAANGVPLDWGLPGVWSTVATVPALAALYGVLGVGLGLVLRNVAAAVGVALMWAFVVEGAAPVLLGRPGILRWLPGEAAHAALAGAASTTTTLAAGAALALLAGYAAALTIAGAAVTSRREVATGE